MAQLLSLILKLKSKASARPLQELILEEIIK